LYVTETISADAPAIPLSKLEESPHPGIESQEVKDF